MSEKLKTIPKIKADLRPSDYEYALLSQHVYDSGVGKPVVGCIFRTYRTWKVIYTRCTNFGYFGAIYQCDVTKQIVIAHRGTNSVLDFYEDYRGIFLNKRSWQKEEASLLVNLIVHQIRAYKHDYQLSFTGHSLGAYLAEISVYYSTTALNFPEVSAVTFESPGSKQSMESLRLKHQVFQPLGHLESGQVKRLDITTYVSYPNMINACNDHVGSLYAINVDTAWSFSHLPGIRLINNHGIDGIVHWFKMATVEKNPNYKRHYMSAWPRGYKQIKIFFKYAVVENGLMSIDPDLIQYEVPPPPSRFRRTSFEAEDIPEGSNKSFEKWISQQKKKFEIRFSGNYRVFESLNSFTVMPLHHFSKPLQHFLKSFYDQIQLLVNNEGKSEDKIKEALREIWKTINMPVVLVEPLLHFEYSVNKINIEEIQLKKTNFDAYQFRKELSSWLKKTGFMVEDLVGFEKVKEAAVMRFKNQYELKPPPLPPPKLKLQT